MGDKVLSVECNLLNTRVLKNYVELFLYIKVYIYLCKHEGNKKVYREVW